MRNIASHPSEYEPSNYAVNGKSVMSAFAMVLACFVSLIAVG